MGDFASSLSENLGTLTGKWKDLDRLVGGDLFTNPEKLGVMRLVAMRPEYRQEGVCLSPGFKQAVLNEIQRVGALPVDAEERSRVRLLGDNSMMFRSDSQRPHGKPIASSEQDKLLEMALRKLGCDSGSEPL